jgi:hypothetical protein
MTNICPLCQRLLLCAPPFKSGEPCENLECPTYIDLPYQTPLWRRVSHFQVKKDSVNYYVLPFWVQNRVIGDEPISEIHCFNGYTLFKLTLIVPEIHFDTEAKLLQRLKLIMLFS